MRRSVEHLVITTGIEIWIQRQSHLTVEAREPARRRYISAVPGEWRFAKNFSKAFDSMCTRASLLLRVQPMVIELSEYSRARPQCSLRSGFLHRHDPGLLSALIGQSKCSVHRLRLSKFMVKEARKKVIERTCVFIIKYPGFTSSRRRRISDELFTMQFLTLAERRTLLTRINEGLIEGGGLLIVEKVSAIHSVFESIWTELYWDFKRRQGFTTEQVLEKANSIRGVLRPLTAEENINLLLNTGYSQVDVFFKWYNWAGFLAIKNQCARSQHAPWPEVKPGNKTAQS